MATIVSRTATAPFDRLKIFLITRPPDLGGASLTSLNPKASMNGAKAIGNAVQRIYAEGGVKGFWVGNGLSVAKIFPESAIKFLSYETSVSYSFFNVEALLTDFITHRKGCLPSTTTVCPTKGISVVLAASCREALPA
jgi:hypothetical protein